MARTTITAQTAGPSAPINPVSMGAVDATNGNQWAYTGNGRLLVHNASAAPITVTIPTPAAVTVAGLDVPDRVVTVDAAAYAYIVESPEARQSDGKVYCDFSAAASVTAALIVD